MDSQILYRVQREDLPRLQKMLVECFARDPLYETLIPDAETRKRLMPELFECDLNEFYETCEIFADSWSSPMRRRNMIQSAFTLQKRGRP